MFFFQGYGDHPDLHSFPTRRSSDLEVVRPAAAVRVHLPPVVAGAPVVGDLLGGRGALRVGDHHPAVAVPLVEVERSEEHTSELQSRLHLVCRLLLEKKNYISTYYKR